MDPSPAAEPPEGLAKVLATQLHWWRVIAHDDTATEVAERIIAEHIAPLLDRAAKAEAAVALLDQLAEDTDDIPCRYDHHGACQEHGGGSEESGACSDREAHELLKRLGVRRALGGDQ